MILKKTNSSLPVYEISKMKKQSQTKLLSSLRVLRNEQNGEATSNGTMYEIASA